MKTYMKYLLVFVLVGTIVGVARSDPAWAGAPPRSSQPAGAYLPNSEIIITETGEYTVGGLCTLEAIYKQQGLMDKAAVDVPAEISEQVPFAYEGDLYLAGCHIRHYKQEQLIREANTSDGSWEVCFGDRPDEELTIYYYPDEIFTDEPVWQPLPTVEQDGFVCAPAVYSGVYAPAGILLRQTETGGGGAAQVIENRAGTVQPPSSSNTITRSGTYAIGGVCSIIVEYFVDGLTNVVHVEENIEISYNVPFPDNEGLIYLPGCHVFHYRTGELVEEVTQREGKWMICFAAVPNRETTIFFYYADDDFSPVDSVWAPLETTVKNGLACAPLTNFTAVYAPVGK
ncbi:MAG: hypothetical protein FJZ87_03035 [Chloroflexi bacterium]|nr:hypothetical protein [Chloroflexota bacterium]